MGRHTAQQGLPQVGLRLLSGRDAWDRQGEDGFGRIGREVEDACASVGPAIDPRRARLEAAIDCVVRLLSADRELARLVLVDPSAAGVLGCARRQTLVDQAVDALCVDGRSRYGAQRVRAEIAVGGAVHAAAERLLADGPVDERAVGEAIGEWLDTVLPSAHPHLRLV